MNALRPAVFGAALAAISTRGLAAELEVDNQALVGAGSLDYTDNIIETDCIWGSSPRNLLDVDSSTADVIASTWVKGGPTEKHPVSWLLDDTEANKNKWVTPLGVSEAAVKVNFGITPTPRIRQIGFKSGNDVPLRDPTSVEIYYCKNSDGPCVLADVLADDSIGAHYAGTKTLSWLDEERHTVKKVDVDIPEMNSIVFKFHNENLDRIQLA